jgi:small subunit ribosomal protein S2
LPSISMKELLEAGVHFGHQTKRWNPKMKEYIFGERNGIYIIDLQKTLKLFKDAMRYVGEMAAQGKNVLFVGTKRQAQETVRDEATRCGMPYVTERWLGGMLTNWSTMHARIKELDRLEGLRDTGEINKLTKKEGLLIGREIIRLLTRLSGIRSMKRVPDVVFIVDVSREEAAVHEANLLKIPVVALVDTNCNPQGIDYVIPSNDDAIRAIKLLVAKVADAVLEGKAMRKEEEPAGEAMAAPEARTEAPARNRKAAKVVEPDEESDEGILLGESTLAKLSATRKPAEAELAEVIAPVEQPKPEETTTEESGPEEAKAEAPQAEVKATAKPRARKTKDAPEEKKDAESGGE